MKAFGLSDKGPVRPDNQDSFSVSPLGDGVLVVVCDGMGGPAGGKLASSIACAAFTEFAMASITACGGEKAAVALSEAADHANRLVYERAGDDAALCGMGTTLVAAYITEKHAVILNIGDSRAYRIGSGKIGQLTHDHSLVQELVDTGRITEYQAQRHPDKNIITRALGCNAFVRSDLFESDVCADDIFLLCSDGLTNSVSEQSIFSSAISVREPEGYCRELIRTALSNGARDNVTAVAVLISGKEASFRG